MNTGVGEPVHAGMPEYFPHHAQIDRDAIAKEYRWRVEQYDGRDRVVAEHRVIGTPRWSEVRNPDTLAELLARTPR